MCAKFLSPCFSELDGGYRHFFVASLRRHDSGAPAERVRPLDTFGRYPKGPL
jgi:hypothetical protein